MHALCQISLAVSCLLYEMCASEKSVQEILLYYLCYILWNVLLEILCLVFFKILLHNCFPEFHGRIKFVDEKV